MHLTGLRIRPRMHSYLSCPNYGRVGPVACKLSASRASYLEIDFWSHLSPVSSSRSVPLRYSTGKQKHVACGPLILPYPLRLLGPGPCSTPELVPSLLMGTKCIAQHELLRIDYIMVAITSMVLAVRIVVRAWQRRTIGAQDVLLGIAILADLAFSVFYIIITPIFFKHQALEAG